MTTPTKRDTAPKAEESTPQLSLNAHLCLELPDFRPIPDAVATNDSRASKHLAKEIGHWLGSATKEERGNLNSASGHLVLLAATDFKRFPRSDISELSRIRRDMLKALDATQLAEGPKVIVRREIRDVPATRIYAWLVRPELEFDFSTAVAILRGFTQGVKKLDARDKELCYLLLESINPTALKQGKAKLTENDSPTADDGQEHDAFWQNRVGQKGPNPWRDRIAQVFDYLPAENARRDEELTILDSTYRSFIAVEVSRQISELFRGRFDEKSRPVETFEEMQVRSAIARQILSDHQLAIISPRTGKPCHPFAKQGRRRAQYTLQPLGGRSSGTDWKFSQVEEALLSPKLTVRPDQYDRSQGR